MNEKGYPVRERGAVKGGDRKLGSEDVTILGFP